MRTGYSATLWATRCQAAPQIIAEVAEGNLPFLIDGHGGACVLAAKIDSFRMNAPWEVRNRLLRACVSNRVQWRYGVGIGGSVDSISIVAADPVVYSVAPCPRAAAASRLFFS